MDRARPVFMQFDEVKFGAVAFMLAETIFGKSRAKLTH